MGYDDITKKNDKLSFKIFMEYGLGHIFNDVCSAMWFSYLLIFFHEVLGFESSEAGILLLVGQVADAVATPFIGYNTDRNYSCWIYKFGKRKFWYFLGTICVITTFPFIFSQCLSCNDSSSRLHQMLYYSCFIVIFQFGWAAVQIAHMSFIPEITSNVQDRTRLAAVRNGATVAASVLVYLITFEILNISGGRNDKIGPDHLVKFQHVVWSVISFGFLCSIVFIVTIKEERKDLLQLSHQDQNKLTTTDQELFSFKKIFLNFNLYLIACVYMSSRLFINLTQIFLSLYLSVSLDMVAIALALVPLALYIASFIASFPVGYLTKFFGRKFTYITGAIIGLSACLWIRFGDDDNAENSYYTTYFIFIVATLLGASGTIVLVSSLDITTKLIGVKTNQGAFIYGIMSFVDKLSNGVVAKIIQDYNDEENLNYYRDVLSFVCGGVLILGMISVIFINNKKETAEENDNNNNSSVNTLDSVSTVSSTTS